MTDIVEIVATQAEPGAICTTQRRTTVRESTTQIVTSAREDGVYISMLTRFGEGEGSMSMREGSMLLTKAQALALAARLVDLAA